MHCENCGVKYSDGLCPNCHEEAFIELHSDEELDFSEEWRDRVRAQQLEAREAQRIITRVLENPDFDE